MFVSRNACFFSQVSAASTVAMALTDSDADAPLSDSGGFLVIHSWTSGNFSALHQSSPSCANKVFATIYVYCVNILIYFRVFVYWCKLNVQFASCYLCSLCVSSLDSFDTIQFNDSVVVCKGNQFLFEATKKTSVESSKPNFCVWVHVQVVGPKERLCLSNVVTVNLLVNLVNVVTLWKKN